MEDMRDMKNMKRYIIKIGNREIGRADNLQETVNVIGCSRTHYYDSFDGKHLMFGGIEFTIIDVVGYYYYSDYRKQMEN